MRDRRNFLGLFLILSIVAAVTFALFWKTTSDRPFFYDESDYMYAGTQGFAANYLDRPSISLVEFIRKGLELSRDKTQRASISEFVRTSGDVTFYRHYHGPVYACWIALWHAFGARDSAVYRASGLVIHLLTVTLIFWLFRLAFPASPPIAAFVAALSFLLNRTALVSSTIVTQHVMYSLWAGITLFLAALFLRTRDTRLWYAACVALGVSFATVESSFVLVAAFLPILLFLGWETGWKAIPGLLGRGTLVFLAAVLVVWPKGVLELGALKGYAYLSYMAVMRKTLSPIGPVELWRFKLTTYPEEFVIPVAALLAAVIFRKRLPDWQAMLPFVIYGFLFIGVTMVITLPYTYYHGSLLVATSVVVGVLFGRVWSGGGAAARVAAALIIGVPLLWMPVRYYRETLAVQAVHDPRIELLAWVSSNDAPGVSLIVPFGLVPTLHYYHPRMETTSYDPAAQPAQIADLAEQPGHILLCEATLCDAVRARLPATAQAAQTGVMAADPDLQSGPLFALGIHPPNR